MPSLITDNQSIQVRKNNLITDIITLKFRFNCLHLKLTIISWLEILPPFVWACSFWNIQKLRAISGQGGIWLQWWLRRGRWPSPRWPYPSPASPEQWREGTCHSLCHSLWYSHLPLRHPVENSSRTRRKLNVEFCFLSQPPG